MDKNELLQCLLDAGLITQPQREEIGKKSEKSGLPPEKLLLDAGIVKEIDIAKILSEKLRVPLEILAGTKPEPAIVKLIPKDVAINYQVLPIRRDENVLTLAMVDPVDITAEDYVRYTTGCQIKRVVTTRADILEMLDVVYGSTESIDNILTKIPQADQVEFLAPQKKEKEEEAEDLSKSESAPIIQLVNALIVDAIVGSEEAPRRANLRPPLKRLVRFSRKPLSRETGLSTLKRRNQVD